MLEAVLPELIVVAAAVAIAVVVDDSDEEANDDPVPLPNEDPAAGADGTLSAAGAGVGAVVVGAALCSPAGAEVPIPVKWLSSLPATDDIDEYALLNVFASICTD